MSNINQYDRNGNQHGEWVDYYSNGRVTYCQNFVHGIKHGLQYGYHDTTLRYRGNWNMGMRVGYWYWYDEKYYHLCLI